jgi:hypothetical protein
MVPLARTPNPDACLAVPPSFDASFSPKGMARASNESASSRVVSGTQHASRAIDSNAFGLRATNLRQLPGRATAMPDAVDKEAHDSSSAEYGVL